MIAADTSTVSAFFAGLPGKDVELFDTSLLATEIVIPPVVLTEILSDPALPDIHRSLVLQVPVLDLLPDYWVRAAASRVIILSKGLRARLPDTLIAQTCIDHDMGLITRNGDFRHFARYCGLKMA